MGLPVPTLKKKVPVGTRIGFIGSMGSGKTTCAKYLEQHYGYTRYSLAGKLKSIAYEMYGITGKDGGDRLVLQGLGSDLRKYDTDVWVKYLLNRIKYVEDGRRIDHKIVIDDIRYLNEASLFKKNKFILVRLQVDQTILDERIANLYPNRPAEAVTHASETEQEQIQADYTLANNTPSDLVLLDNLMTLLDQESSSNG